MMKVNNPPTTISVERVSHTTSYSIWADGRIVARFVESTEHGHAGEWFAENWWGIDAKGMAELQANLLGDRYGVKVDKSKLGKWWK